jgi:hypothetical protein
MALPLEVCETNCEVDGATLLDNLQLMLRAPAAASRNPSTSRGKKPPDVTFPSCSASTEGLVLSVAYVSGSIAR